MQKLVATRQWVAFIRSMRNLRRCKHEYTEELGIPGKGKVGKESSGTSFWVTAVPHRILQALPHLRLPSEGSNGCRRASQEFFQVILHTHDDSLRLTSPVYHKAFLISLDSSEDLPELGAGCKRRHNLRHSFA